MIGMDVIDKAVQRALKTMTDGQGGPFGACIMAPDGRVFVASNQVLKDHDPTAHAEICCIREASRALGTHDLTGCVLYTTCMPCPMCLSAIIWANIKEVYYSCTAADAQNAGFRDDFIYRYIQGRCSDSSVLSLKQIERDRALKLFETYTQLKGEIY